MQVVSPAKYITRSQQTIDITLNNFHALLTDEFSCYIRIRSSVHLPVCMLKRWAFY